MAVEDIVANIGALLSEGLAKLKAGIAALEAIRANGGQPDRN